MRSYEQIETELESRRTQSVKSVRMALEALDAVPLDLQRSIICQDCDAARRIDKARESLREALQSLGPLQGRPL